MMIPVPSYQKVPKVKIDCPDWKVDPYWLEDSPLIKVRICGHSGISALTGKIVKGDDDSVIKELFLLFSHTTDFEDFSILATNSNDFRVTLMESLLINRDCNQYIFHNFFHIVFTRNWMHILHLIFSLLSNFCILSL